MHDHVAEKDVPCVCLLRLENTVFPLCNPEVISVDRTRIWSVRNYMNERTNDVMLPALVILAGNCYANTTVELTSAVHLISVRTFIKDKINATFEF